MGVDESSMGGRTGEDGLGRLGGQWSFFLESTLKGVTEHRQVRGDEPEEQLRMWQSQSPSNRFLEPGGGQRAAQKGHVAGKTLRRQ